MAKRTRRQHVVSKFFLRGFAENGRLIRVPAGGGAAHSVSIDDATVTRDFYSVEDDKGELSDFFEQEFAKIEGRAAPVLIAIMEGEWPLRPEQKEALWPGSHCSTCERPRFATAIRR